MTITRESKREEIKGVVISYNRWDVTPQRSRKENMRESVNKRAATVYKRRHDFQ